jgi:uncharacterized membrane protein YdjX (TVP38/TMEM64 family)
VTPRAKKLAAALVVVAAIGFGFFLRRQLGLEIDPENLRRQVEEMGPLAPVVFVAALSLRFVLLIPSAVLLTVGGLVFGVTLGTVYGALGLTIMGLLQFLLVQVAGAEALRSRVPPRFAGAITAARSWRGAATLSVVSAYPVGPQTPVQLAAALAGMSLVTFLASIGAGGTLRAGLFSWFGSSLLEGEGVLLVGALMVFVIALPFLHPRSRGVVLSYLQPKDEVAASGADDRLEGGVRLAGLERRDDGALERTFVRTDRERAEHDRDARDAERSDRPE